MSNGTVHSKGGEQPPGKPNTDPARPSAREIVVTSPAIKWMLNAIAYAASLSAMAQLMAGTACWCVAGNGPPPDLLVAGVGSAILAVAVAVLLADRGVVLRWLKPLLWAFVGEYALAFGTLGLGFLSTATYQFTLPPHYPLFFLLGQLGPGLDRWGPETGYALVVVTEWLLMASAIYLVWWYVHRRHTRNDRA